MVAPSLASGQRALVSYSAPPHFLASPNWNKVHAALLAQLPLRNIHWKPTSGSSIRTIQELDITLVPLDNIRDEHTTQYPATLLEKPLLNLYVVHCEDTDIESYRALVKKQIKDWHTNVVSRKSQEWLILHIVRPDVARTQPGNFFQIKGSVFEKIKADFNLDKRDRCVQVSWTSGNENPLIWAEFVNKIKDCLLWAFEVSVVARQEEVRRSEGQQLLPGWNFCTFFILKESLAISYEGMNLFEEALLQYNELEMSFFHVWKAKSLSWFGSLINLTPNDDSATLLSTTRKPYRDLILGSTISAFDFRIYMLTRQCELLAKIGSIHEITKKVGAFLGGFGARLREVEETLPSHFVESWIFSSALSVVEQCNKWSIKYKQDGFKSEFNAGKGELLELACSQLDIIGVLAGHLPTKAPFATSYSTGKRSWSSSSGQITNADLLNAMDNPDTFYELYVSITNRAIDMYAKAGRRKFALKLHGSLAALDLHRGRLEEALATYASLPAHYAPHMWTSLESFMLSRALDAHAKLEKDRDVEWIHILLSFLKTYVENGGTDLLMHDEEKTDYVATLVHELMLATSQLEADLAHPDHPVMDIKVTNDARLAEVSDGAYLDATIWNHLPCALPADEVSIVITGRESEKLKFSSSIEGLPPGKTKVKLFSPISLTGTYLLDMSEVRMSRLLLHWSHRRTQLKGSLIPKNGSVILVRIPADPLGLTVYISQSNRIELGKGHKIMVTLFTGRNHVSRVKIRPSSQGVTFKCQEAVVDGDFEMEASEDFIAFEDIPKEQLVVFSVPHSDTSAIYAMKVAFDVEYTTISEPAISRVVRISRVLITTLPIAVNVEDFFRGTRLISKFAISTTSHQHVRISSVNLDAPEGLPDGLKIGAAEHEGIITVTPSQSANFMFTLDSEHGPVRESLSLVIKYRMLREEVESLIDAQVGIVLAESPSDEYHRVNIVSKLVTALERDAAWVEMYGITGELSVPETPEEDKELDELLCQVKKRLRSHCHHGPTVDVWREICIPVDVPYMNIVAAAQIHLVSAGSSTQDSVYAGQPVSALLEIHTSFHWGPASERGRQYKMRYNVEEMVREWLVSGPKRGDFYARDGVTHTVPITLIPLHHGSFALPRVSVTALPAPVAVEDEEMMSSGAMSVPSVEIYQVHGANRILVLPRGGRSTFVVNMGAG